MEVDEIGKLVQLAVGAAKGAGRELPFDVHVLTDEELPTLVNAIVSVLPICTHRRTRRNLYSLLRQLFSQFSEFLPLMLSALKKEALRPVSMAISNRFLLLECTNEIATLACKDAIFKSYVGEIVVLQKILLPSCTRPEARQNLRISAQRHTRTALRCVFREDKIYVDNYMEELTRGSVLNIPLLDLVCGVVWRLQPRETYHACIERYQEKILELYVKEVVGSRSIVSPHLAGMPNFMSTFLTETALEQVVFPAVEKALLRAPEVLLEGIFTFPNQSYYRYPHIPDKLRSKGYRPFFGSSPIPAAPAFSQQVHQSKDSRAGGTHFCRSNWPHLRRRYKTRNRKGNTRTAESR